MAASALKIDELSKHFGNVTALDGLSLDIREGDIHGIVGHNGSGKSTLVKILAGGYVPEAGSMELFGQKMSFPADGALLRETAIAVVHQDLGLVPSLSIVDNFRVRRYGKGPLGTISWAKEEKLTKERLCDLGVKVNPRAKTSELAISDQVLLCVARALLELEIYTKSGADRRSILVLDEPTSSLPRDKVETFLEVISSINRNYGATVLLVSHNPRDIMAVSQRFSALRDGSCIGTYDTGEVSYATLAGLMAGKAEDYKSPLHPKSLNVNQQTPALSVEKLEGSRVHALDFSIHEGEIVGLTGLVGSGYEDVPYLLCGALDRSGGTIRVGELVYKKRTPMGLRSAGVLFLPSDRRKTSGVPLASIRENATLGGLDAFSRFGILKQNSERSAVRKMLEDFRVRPADPERRLGVLSGGQQQKTIIGRSFLSKEKVLMIDEPTVAIDVGARDDIHAALRGAAERGSAILVTSCQYEDLPMFCDRVLVMAAGRIVGELSGESLEEEKILELCYSSN